MRVRFPLPALRLPPTVACSIGHNRLGCLYEAPGDLAKYAVVAERQTRWSKKPVKETSWRFESSLPHFMGYMMCRCTRSKGLRGGLHRSYVPLWLYSSEVEHSLHKRYVASSNLARATISMAPWSRWLKTPPFQGGNTGSNPVGVTIIIRVSRELGNPRDCKSLAKAC